VVAYNIWAPFRPTPLRFLFTCFRTSSAHKLDEGPSCSTISFGYVNEIVKRLQNAWLTKQCRADAVKSVSLSHELKAVTVDGLLGGCRNAGCESSFSQKSPSTSKGYSAVKLPVSCEHIRQIKTRGGAHFSSFVARGRPKIAGEGGVDVFGADIYRMPDRRCKRRVSS